MNVAEVYLFCSSTSPACKPCIQVISSYDLLARETQIVRLDTLDQRHLAKSGNKFQIRNVPSLVVIYADGDTSVFLGQKKVLAWFFNRLKAFQRISAQQQPPPEVHRVPKEGGGPGAAAPRPNQGGLYSSASSPSTKKVEFSEDIEFLESDQVNDSVEGERKASPAALDVNAVRKDKDHGMGELVDAARKMERNRQSHLSAVSEHPTRPLFQRSFN